MCFVLCDGHEPLDARAKCYALNIVSPQVHVLKAWSPADGTILGGVETLRSGSRAGGVTQVIGYPPSKCKVLSSTVTATKKKSEILLEETGHRGHAMTGSLPFFLCFLGTLKEATVLHHALPP
jgi:hypothetical protein